MTLAVDWLPVEYTGYMGLIWEIDEIIPRQYPISTIIMAYISLVR